MEEHSHVNLVLSLVDDDLAHAPTVVAERHSQLELADAPLPKPECVTQL
jgi:hypothetical protein